MPTDNGNGSGVHNTFDPVKSTLGTYSCSLGKSVTIIDSGKIFKPIHGMQAARKHCELHLSDHKIVHFGAHWFSSDLNANYNFANFTGVLYKQLSFNHNASFLKQIKIFGNTFLNFRK